MAIILNMWEAMVSVTLNPAKADMILLSDEAIQSLIVRSEEEPEKVKSFLIEGIVDNTTIRDKRQFIQINQAIIIRLLDKLYAYKQCQRLNEKIIDLYDIISRHLEEILNFIEDFFGEYFDRDQKAHDSYLIVSLEDLCRQLEKLRKVIASNENFDKSLHDVLINNFTTFCNKKSGATYYELMYQKDLINELLNGDTFASELSIKEVLFYFNFNDDDYVAYLYKKLNSLVESFDSKTEKITSLRYEQKNMNQLRSKLDSHFTIHMPSLKEQVNHWIDEEIKFLESELSVAKLAKAEQESEDKIHTSLSVAKVALLIRLMIIDKIITNRVVAHVLRIVIKTVTTLQKENISFGSLETKYHNPDRGTISAVKDMLFRWINILGKL